VSEREAGRTVVRPAAIGCASACGQPRSMAAAVRALRGRAHRRADVVDGIAADGCTKWTIEQPVLNAENDRSSKVLTGGDTVDRSAGASTPSADEHLSSAARSEALGSMLPTALDAGVPRPRPSSMHSKADGGSSVTRKPASFRFAAARSLR
jgi:hypothetical protein